MIEPLLKQRELVRHAPSSDTSGFARMMNAILDARPFAEAVAEGYHQDVHSLWEKFAQVQAGAK